VPLRLRFLLDTNILIPLQDSMIVLQPSLTNFIRLSNAHGHQLLYHRASAEDIRRDTDVGRRDRTLARLAQYTELEQGSPCPWNTPETTANDRCDNEILYALQCNAVHALVTEDQGIHRRARSLGLADRVYFIQAADNWLRLLHEPGAIKLPNIQDVELHTLSGELPGQFFESIRADYIGFDDWFRRKAMEGRRAWIYRNDAGADVGAICIYAVQTNEPITDDGQMLRGDALKLCTLKVGETVRGRKIGELFLRAAFEYATRYHCGAIFLHANPGRQSHLASLLEDFGFSPAGTYRGDEVYVKSHPVEPPPLDRHPFDYARLFYPHYFPRVRKFIVPIRPEFHKILFPDFQEPGHALPEGHPQRHVGNAIKLAYLCHTPNRQPQCGDIVLFYRSFDTRAVTTLGIVESYQRSHSADEIARIVSRRTVYTQQQIEEMARTETTVMLFRLIRHFKNVISFQHLRDLGVVRGPIQSIIGIADESFSRILRAAER